MAPTNKSNKSTKSSSSPSSSTQAAAPNQEDSSSSRRTTRSMKAKQDEAATTSAVTADQQASNVAKKATSKSAHPTQSASSSTMASSAASVLGKRKTSASGASGPQQTTASKKAKTQDNEPVTSHQQADEPAPQPANASKEATPQGNETVTSDKQADEPTPQQTKASEEAKAQDNEPVASDKQADEPAPQQDKASKKAKTASSTTKVASAAVLGKRKASGSGDNNSQQNNASKKAKTQDSAPITSNQQANKPPVSDIAHLVSKYFPKTKTRHLAKTRVNSNGQPHKSQADIDDELETDLQRIRHQPFHWGTQVEPATNQDMLDDFVKMKFSPDEIDTMMSKRDTLEVDGTAQRPFVGPGKSVPNTGPIKEKKRASPKGKCKYQALKVFAKQDWILFDPLKGTPDDYGTPPEVMLKWAFFEPGNPRVLLHNIKKKTLLAAATPQALQEATVDYTETGPKIAGWKPIGTATRKPSSAGAAAAAATTAPEPEAEAEAAETPALGRGARRKIAAAKKRDAEEAVSAAKVEETPAVPAVPATVAQEPVEAEEEEESVLGEGKQKRKRRAGKPKKSAAVVENSSSQ